MRRALHASWMSLAALVLLVAGALAWVLFTESGLRAASALASRKLGPITLAIRGVHGTLARGFGADEVIVTQRRVRVVARGIEGRIRLLPLFWQTIHIIDLQVREAEVAVPRVPPDGKPWKPHILVGLLTIEVERIGADHAVLVVPTGQRLEGTHVQARAALGLRDVRVYEGGFDYGTAHVEASGNLHAAEPLGLWVRTRLVRELPGQVPWQVAVQAEGDLRRLPLSGRFEKPFQAEFAGTAGQLTSDWNWEGKADVQSLDLRAFGAGAWPGVLSGQVQGRFDRNGIRARGTAVVPGLETAPVSLELDSGYASQGLAIRRLDLRDAPSGGSLQVAGEIRSPGGPLQLALHGTWRELRWPLARRDAPVGLPQGRFSLEGRLPYQLRASGPVRIATLAPMEAEGSATLARAQLGIDALALRGWGGEAQLRGAVQWRANPPWQLAGTVRHLDVAAIRPGQAGRLDFAAEARGTGTDLAGRVHDLRGRIRGLAASGQGGFALAAGQWQLQQAHFQLGGTRVSLDGLVGERTDLRYALDADDLGLLASDAAGRVQASGHLRFGVGAPLWTGELAASGLRWDGLGARQLTARIDFDPEGSGHAATTLEARALQWRDRQFERLALASTGNASAHQWSAELRGPGVQLAGGGSGRLAQGRWLGQLERLSASDGAELHFGLEAPAMLALAPAEGDWEVARLCLRDGAAHLCGSGQSQAGARRVALEAGNVPLHALTVGLVTATDFAGTITLELQAEAAANAAWRGTLAARLAGAQARHRTPGGRSESFNLGDGALRARLDDEGLLATAALRAGEQGTLDAELRAQLGDDDWRRWPLSGKFSLETASLGFIESYAAQVDRVAGQLAARLQLAGTLGAPELDGELKVRDAQVDAYAINLAVRELAFTAALHGNSLALDGSFKAGTSGSARFDGALQWRDSLPWGQLHLAGTELRVANLPEARILASPDVQLRFAGRRIDVNGTIDLPYARLQRPDQLANAVRASSDEVLVAADQPAPGEAWKVLSDVTLRLGERVTIDTLGLTGRLSGSVRSVTDETGFTRGTGELAVEEGKYAAYGRKLDIEHGRLQFSNGPINDPAIDLRATKTFPDIRAGVNVRGTLRSPRMTFFSDPPVSQSQIVSLLLAGGSLEAVQNTSDPASRNNSARNNMLLQGSAMLFQQLGNRVGLDDVSVESNLNNDTSLVLGRYLSPRLYVSYGVSLAEAINTIKMRYTIGDHWTIKTEAGAARSADLVYTIEH